MRAPSRRIELWPGEGRRRTLVYSVARDEVHLSPTVGRE